MGSPQSSALPQTGVEPASIKFKFEFGNRSAEYWQPGTDYSASAYNIDPSLANTAWCNAVTSNSWANWYTTFTYLTDYKYHIEARAHDVASNYLTAFATADFIMDQQIPTSGISYPASNSMINSITQITGTMAAAGLRYPDTVSPIKVATKELGLPSNGKWWDNNNKDFQLGSIPNTDAVTLYSSSWSFTGIIGSYLTSGTSYYVTSRAFDNATPANDEGFFSVRSTTFTYDANTPLFTLQFSWEWRFLFLVQLI